MRIAALASLVSLSLVACNTAPTHPSTLDADYDVPGLNDRPATDLGRPETAVDVTVADNAPTDAVDATTDVATDLATDVVSDASTDAATDVSTEAATDVSTDAGAMDASATDAMSTDAAAADVSFGDLPEAGAWIPLGDGTCHSRARSVPQIAGVHVEPDAGPITWLTNPPSSGPHYPNWARWGAFPNIPRGNWLHNLEHGGVAMLYRCASGTCDTTRDALLRATDGIPTDPACMPSDAAPTRVRVVITNDNEITTPIAAAAWGALYEADCVDATSLRQFYMMFAGHAPEDFCADGFVP